MTQNAIIMMSVSVGSIILLFLFCITMVIFSPDAADDDDE